MTCKTCGHDLIDLGRSEGPEWIADMLCICCDQAVIGADLIDQHLSEVADVACVPTATVTDLADDLKGVCESTLVIPFGAHRGKRISEAPADYLRWLAGRIHYHNRRDWGIEAREELARRRAASIEQQPATN